MSFCENKLQIEGIREIKSKAYLGERSIRELILSKEVEIIGQWAFAHMKALQRLKVPRRELTMEKEILLGCDNLQEIVIVEDDGTENKEEAALLGCAIRLLGKQELFAPMQVGTPLWYEKWDEIVIAFLHEEDGERFIPVFFGGEEDYCKDEATDLEMYCQMIRRRKLTLCFERLKQPKCLAEDKKKQYRAYIEQCCRERLSELGRFLAEESVKDMAVLQLFLEENLQGGFENWWMSHQDAFCPEAKALLIQKGGASKDITEIFSL